MALAVSASASAQGLLSEAEEMREIAIEISDGRIFVPATVGATAGVMMLDTGTADAVLLNRDGLTLAPGEVLGEGLTASGQRITVMGHLVPEIVLAGRPVVLDAVRSGNFGFVQDQLRPDFLGFAGAGLVDGLVFEPDVAAGVLRLWPAGSLPQTLQAAHVWLPMLRDGGDLPRLEGRVGGASITVELDTGDGGTLYLSADRAEALRKAGLLTGDAGRVRLHGLTLGGRSLGGFALREVEAGGPQDHRDGEAGDAVRLGAGFIAACDSLWDFGENRLGLRTCADD